MQSGRVFHTEVRSILSPVTGFLAEAGFTHSLTPARNCGFGCSYCYVPTMGIYGGLKPGEAEHWGQWTTFKSNAAFLLRRQLRPSQVIYCSPLVDPYQPAEEAECLMAQILEAAIEKPPKTFVIQTRGPLIVRNIPLLQRLSERTRLRVSFSLTTNRENIRRQYESRCPTIQARLEAMKSLCAAGLRVHAALAPLLPCDPEELAAVALDASNGAIACDPFHIREEKRRGAITWQPAHRIAAAADEEEWFNAGFQREAVARIAAIAAKWSRGFAVGPPGFRQLTED